MILQQKFASYRRKERALEKLEAQKKEIEKKITQAYNTGSWVDTILKPFARVMAKHLGRKKWEIMGPFGLGNETSVWFYDTKEDYKNSNVDSITFRPDLSNRDNLFGIKVKSEIDTAAYAKDTIGALNGFNKESITPPADADLKWFADHISYAKY